MYVFPSHPSTHFCELGMENSSSLYLPNYVSGESSGITWISALNFWKAYPCNGLVKRLANILPVRKYLTFRYPIYIISLIRNYLMYVCFVWLPLDNLPIFSRSIALRLSWYMTKSSTLSPWASIKYFDHGNAEIILSSPICSNSVEILEFIFCLFYMLVTYIFPRNIVAPLWIQKYGCIAYDVSTHHFTMFILSNLIINGMWIIYQMYCSTCHNFCQSSMSKWGMPQLSGCIS